MRAMAEFVPGFEAPIWKIDYEFAITKSGPILSVPYTQECNDVAMMLIQHREASEFCDRTIDQSKRIYADAEDSARITAISVHPTSWRAPQDQIFPPHTRPLQRIGAIDVILICELRAGQI